MEAQVAPETQARVGENLLRSFGLLLENNVAIFNVLPIYTHSSPVSVCLGIQQQSSLLPLFMRENRPLCKFMLALYSICSEVQKLSEEAATYIPVVYMYEEPDTSEYVTDSEAALRFSKLLPVLNRISLLQVRCHAVLSNALQQLLAIYGSSSFPLSLVGFHLQVVFEYMGQLLADLVKLDMVLELNHSLKRHWALYQQTVKQNQGGAGNTGRGKQLLHFLHRLEESIMSGTLFRRTVDGLSLKRQKEQAGFKPSRLLDELLTNLLNMVHQLSTAKCPEGSKVIAVVSLTVLHASLVGKSNVALIKNLLSLHRRLPGVPLWEGGSLWKMDDFLLKNVPDLTEKNLRGSSHSVYSSWVNIAYKTAVKDFPDQRLQLNRWCLDCIASASSADFTTATLKTRCLSTLLEQGIEILAPFSSFTRRLVELYLSLDVPIPSDVALHMGYRLELLKSVESCLLSISPWIRRATVCAVKKTRLQLLRLLLAVRSRIDSMKNVSISRLDILTALDLACSALNGPISSGSILSIRLALSICAKPDIVSDAELSDVVKCIVKLQLLSQPLKQFRLLTDCRFVYWHIDILSPHLRQVSQRPDFWQRLPMMVSPTTDASLSLNRTCHLPKLDIINRYDKGVVACLNKEILEPLLRHIETELRLDVHSRLNLVERPRPLLDTLLQSCQPFVSSPLVLSGCVISVPLIVRSHLEQVFYHLSVVALHDRSKYLEMSQLARTKYRLACAESHLPSNTLDQGVDLLAVARNMQKFVTTHTYDVFSHGFIQSSAVNNHLVTVSIQRVANSLCTHGVGVINTVVNVAYQYVRQQVSAVSQLMCDGRLEARLGRDRLHVEQQCGGRYPHHRADRFCRGVTALGQSPDGTSLLGRLLVLLSQLGSTLGLIRAVHCGCMRCVCAALHFAPTATDADQTGSEGVSSAATESPTASPSTCESMRCVEQCQRQLTDMSSSRTNYFSFILSALSPAIRSETHRHLEPFYMVVPPLLLHQADAVSRNKSKCGGVLSGSMNMLADEASAMGIVFMLHALGQVEAYNSLEWSEEVMQHFQQEMAVARSQIVSQDQDAGLRRTAELTLKRLQQECDQHVHFRNAMLASHLIMRGSY